MEKSIDIETIALKLESQENRITVLEHLIFDSKDVLTLEKQQPIWVSPRVHSTS